MDRRSKVKAALAHSHKTQQQVANDIGTTLSNFNQKLRRGTFTDAELAAIADSVGAKFHPFSFEFADKIIE